MLILFTSINLVKLYTSLIGTTPIVAFFLGRRQYLTKKKIMKLRYVGVPDAIVVIQGGGCQLPDKIIKYCY